MYQLNNKTYYFSIVVFIVAFSLISCNSKEFHVYVNKGPDDKNVYKSEKTVLIEDNGKLLLNFSVDGKLIDVGVFAKSIADKNTYVRLDTNVLLVPKIYKKQGSESDTLEINVKDITSFPGESYLSLPLQPLVGKDCYLNGDLYKINDSNQIIFHKKNLNDGGYLFLTINFAPAETVVIDNLSNISVCNIYIFHNYLLSPLSHSNHLINELYFDPEKKEVVLFDRKQSLREIIHE